MSKKKIVVFSGAGLDKESGIATFRDSSSGLWNNHKIEDVCTPQGWSKDKTKVLDFYNERRREMPNVNPNLAHDALVSLEEKFDVTHVTQNVSDLLERAGATNVLHLHGELTKARTSKNFLDKHDILMGKTIKPIDIGYNDINIGDMCPENGGQLRPHIVWFSEMPFKVIEAANAFKAADIIVIIGTSLQITYTLTFFQETKIDTPIFFIDPEPSTILTNEYPELSITYINKKAVEGVCDFVEKLMKSEE